MGANGEANPFGITDVNQYASPAFADIDGDGDLDLFIGDSYGLTYFFQNTAAPGTTTPAYTWELDAYGEVNPFGIINVNYNASPAFADIDGDGDLDLFIGDIYGNTLFSRNTTPPPTAIAPVGSTTANGTYGIGDVINLTVSFNEVVLVNTTGGTPTLQLKTGSTDRYATYSSGSGSSTLSFQYIVQDGDNTSDLDQFSSTALTLNGGVIADAAGNPAILTLAAPGQTGSLRANADLVIEGVVPTDTTPPTGSLEVVSPPAYTQEGDENPFGIPNVGYNARPTFTDIDSDGDLDLFIGDVDGNTLFFRNTASPNSTTPAFTQEGGNNPFGITNDGLSATPTFADIDGDGDLDLFIGNYNGDTHFFRNNGSASTPSYTQEGGINPFGITNVTASAIPTFADIDGDGDLDLLIGNYDGNTRFFRNTGSASTPAFTQEGGENPFNIQRGGTYATPAFADIDGDSDLDLFIGNGDGNTLFFRNTADPGATIPAFTKEGGYTPFGIPSVTKNASPALADIDADGDLDLFIGNYEANTVFFRNTNPPPTVIAPVSSTTANGTYGIGEVINLTIGFSEDVVVDTSSGTPTLQLETGSTDRYATYSSGSGSSTLTFQYRVQDGDNTSDLDQFSSTALTLNGGVIADAAGNPAILTLAEPGQTGSLSANADLVVSANGPTITGVASSTADGTYTIGDVINLTIGFSTAVDVDTSSGTPTLQLETGSTDRYAIYSSGSGSSTLTFQYTVQEGDSSTDLDQLSSTALTLNGGTINDAVGSPAFLTLAAPGDSGSIGAGADLIIDTTRPTGSLGSFATVPAYIQQGDANQFGISDFGTYALPAFADIDDDEDLDLFIGNYDGDTLFFRNTGSASAPAFIQEGGNTPFGIPNNYEIFDELVEESIGGYAAPTLADIDGDGDLDFFLSGAIGGIYLLRNTAPLNAINPEFILEDSDGAFMYGEAPYHPRPVFADIDRDGDLDIFIGDEIGVNWRRNDANPGATSPDYVYLGEIHETHDIEFSGDGQLNFFDADGDSDLDLLMGVSDGIVFFRNTAAPDSTNFAFTQEGGDFPFGIADIRNEFANYLPALADIDDDGDLDLFIGNDRGNILFYRNTAATPVAPINTTTASGIYGIGDVINLTVGFSEAVVVDTTSGTPTLQLETGTIDRYATYSSGSGSSTLTFQYTVQDGDNTTELDQLSSRALSLNGGTINDAAGNTAILTLAEPGETSSLSANADLVIDGNVPSLSVAIYNGGDGVINAIEQFNGTFSGSTTDVEDGQTVSIAITSDAGGTTIKTSATVSSNFYFATGVDLSSLGDGSLSITADVDDLAGNSATQASTSANKDTAAPSLSVSIDDDGDGFLDAAEASFVSISGSTTEVENGQTVSISISSDAGGTPITTNASVTSNSYVITGVDLSSLGDGALSITADVDDIAGNSAAQATDFTTKIASVPFISVAINDGGDGFLNTAETSSVSISGTTTGVEDGQTVSIAISSDAESTPFIITTSATVANNSYSTGGLDLSFLGDGSLSITADVDDFAGNSAPQAFITVTKNTSSPSFTTVVETIGNTALLKNSEGVHYAQNLSTGLISAITVNGKPVSTSSKYRRHGAENFDGANHMASTRLSDGLLYKWTLNDNWERTANTRYALGSSGYYQTEEDFDQDFDGDGTVGNPIEKTIRRGTNGADQFTFDQFEPFTKNTADRIIGFKPSQGDTIGVSAAACPSLLGADEITFVTARNAKEARRLSRQDINFVYFQDRGRLFFNGNGVQNGWGDRDEGGTFAFMKKKPELSVDDFTLLA